ncbi:MAG: histidine phosphatase family protein [Syntrophales bacterium]
MELTLVRHGETLWNKEGRVQGSSDIELSDIGLSQARRLAFSSQGPNIKTIYSSPMKRAHQTAQIINRMHNVPIYLEPGLLEMDQGDFEGLTFKELIENEKDFLQQWKDDPASVTMPNGESLVELQKRAWSVVANIIDKAENALITSHGLTIAVILCKINNTSLSQFRKFSVGTASKTVVSFKNGSASIDVFNDRTHLDMDCA